MYPPYFKSLARGSPVVPAPDPNAVNEDFYGVSSFNPKLKADALAWMSNPPQVEPGPYTKQFLPTDDRTHTLTLLNDVLYWKAPKLVAVVVPVVAADELESNPPFVNENYDWLTYEVVLNKPKFRKTNQSRKVGLYAVEIKDMQVWLVDNLRKESVDAIAEAFFPDHTPAEVKLLSDRSWWWKQQDDLNTLQGTRAPYRKLPAAVDAPLDALPALEPVTQEDLVGEHVAAARYGLRIHLPRHVVLPYNYWDNLSESRALGTMPDSPEYPRTVSLMQVNHGTDPGDSQCWDMWRTASRSCIVRVNRVKDLGAPWALKDWTYWSFSDGDKERKDFKNELTAADAPRFANTAFKKEVQGGAKFDLKKRTEYHFSMKTGVNFVGFESQPGKDSIGIKDEWLVGCMRSDYMRQVEQLARARGPLPSDFLIQTEIMMLLERRVTSPSLEKAGVDGLALREIWELEKANKVYFSPISIGFVGLDMRTLTEEFGSIDDPVWCDFWRTNWAEQIGRAKALLMIRYGIQHANPNVQNSLLEFTAGDPPTGPVRVVIRDVADALLVREVAWALFGEDVACPQGRDAHAMLKRMSVPVLRFNFRTTAQGEATETGSTDPDFGKEGIQFLWHRFSAHYTAWKPAKLEELPKGVRGKVLRLMATWMVAHSAAYVRAVERALGKEFGDIRWDTLLSPEHDPERFMTPVTELSEYEAPGMLDRTWEEDAAKVIQDYLGDQGREKICEYHNGRWVDAPVAFEILLLDAHGAKMPLTLLSYESTDKTLRGSRITDPDGKVPFYSKSFAEFTFQAGVRSDPDAGLGGWTLEKVDVAAVGPVDGVLTTVRVRHAAPVVTLTAPAHGSTIAVGPVSVSADAAAGKCMTLDCVVFQIDGVEFEKIAAPGPYVSMLDATNLKTGPHIIRVIARDKAGHETSGEVTVTV